MALSLAEIAAYIGAEVRGERSIMIERVAPLVRAGAQEITFLSDKKYLDQLGTTSAAAVMVTAEMLPFCKGNVLVVKDPYVAFAKVAQLLDTTPMPATSIHPTAVIAENVVMGVGVAIGAHTVIESGVVLGDEVSIGAGCFIGKDVVIDAETHIWSNVSIYHGVRIGHDCLIQSGTVIGSDGFGYANEMGEWVKIPQIGAVRIGNRVEIGANTCIDRGALDDTVIGDNVIIDNLCQIAHNVEIGYGTAMAGATTIAGSTKIGKYCIIGGATVINGHIEICDKATITGMAMVMRSITKPGTYSSGIPAQTNKEWRKTAARTLHIDEMYNRLQQLERIVAQLQSK